jgi:hypothetical protein
VVKLPIRGSTLCVPVAVGVADGVPDVVVVGTAVVVTVGVVVVVGGATVVVGGVNVGVGTPVGVLFTVGVVKVGVLVPPMVPLTAGMLGRPTLFNGGRFVIRGMFWSPAPGIRCAPAVVVNAAIASPAAASTAGMRRACLNETDVSSTRSPAMMTSTSFRTTNCAPLIARARRS